MKINEIKCELQNRNPLIHCITNPISINQCANTILALGARPVMAEHPKETYEITKSAKSLLVNLGNITDARIKSIKKSLHASTKYNIPCVIDLVGISCSSLRRKFAYKLCKKHNFSVIKGNYSEILSLYDNTYFSSGVDSEKSLDADYIKTIAEFLSQKYNTVILASGKRDIITNGKRTVFIDNGTPMLSKITGTGCMLGAVCASFLAATNPFDAALCACTVLGICGEMSECKNGTASFLQNLINNFSLINDEIIKNYLKEEVIKDE